jgi:hypothetical protein
MTMRRPIFKMMLLMISMFIGFKSIPFFYSNYNTVKPFRAEKKEIPIALGAMGTTKARGRAEEET